MLKIANIKETSEGFEGELLGIELDSMVVSPSSLEVRPSDLSEINLNIIKSCDKIVKLYADSANTKEFKSLQRSLYLRLESNIDELFNLTDLLKRKISLSINESYQEETKERVEHLIEESLKGKSEDVYIQNVKRMLNSFAQKIKELWNKEYKKEEKITRAIQRVQGAPILVSATLGEGYECDVVVKGIPKLKERLDHTIYMEFLEDIQVHVQRAVDAHIDECNQKKRELLESFTKLLGGRVVYSRRDLEESLTIGEFMKATSRIKAVWSEGFLATDNLTGVILKRQKIYGHMNQKIIPLLERMEKDILAQLAKFPSSDGLKIYDVAYDIKLIDFMKIQSNEDLLKVDSGESIAINDKTISLKLLSTIDPKCYSEVVKSIKRHVENKIKGEKVNGFYKLENNKFVKWSGVDKTFNDKQVAKACGLKNILNKMVSFDIFEYSVEHEGQKLYIEEAIKYTTFEGAA